MRKEIIIKEDGRYLILYWFEEKKEGEDKKEDQEK